MGSHNNRKSMNNLQINEKLRSEALNEQRSIKNDSKQSTKMSSNKAPIPPINNSSSQSSLNQMTGIMDLGSKKKGVKAQTSMNTQEERRHETLKIDDHKVSKPLMSKTSHDMVKNIETTESFDGRSNKQNFTSQSIVKSQPQSSDSEEPEEENKYATNQPIRVEKQEESSEEKEVEQEQNDKDDSDEEEEFPIALNGLIFSFLPQEVAERLNNEEDWKRRTQAIQETENLIKKQFARPNENFMFYVPDILRKMCKMMHDSNFKVSLTSLRIIHNLWMKFPKEIENNLPDLVRNLTDKLSDNKIVIRHAVLKIFFALVWSLGAKKIINLAFQYIDHENWHIREEILSVLIMAWVTSSSITGLFNPKMLNQIWQMVSDDKQKVRTAAFEALCVILSKDSSTAIILNSYLDAQVYNSISERWLSRTLASVNYDGIVEFPTPQTSNSNHLIYPAQSHDNESKSAIDLSEYKKHTQSADHTIYSQNFQKTSTMIEERPKVTSFGQVPKQEIQGSTTNSIGNKLWMPGFNMTASSIKSEQSVRVSKEPSMQTPIQYSNKVINDNPQDRNLHQTVEKNLNYTPEIHPNKPRTFANGMNPSMTAHSMNIASTNMNSVQKTNSRSPISQIDKYDDQATVPDYAPHSINNPMGTHFNSKNMIPNKGPIKPPIGSFGGASTQSVLHTDVGNIGYWNFDDDNMSESRQHRYSQHSNKSLDSRNRNKNSFSQKKPINKSKNIRPDPGERSLSIDAKNDAEDLSNKFLTPEQEWKQILDDLQKKTDWEKQFKACNTIKDFSNDYQKFFKPTDPFFGEIMNELSSLCNSLRTQLSRNALGTFAIVFENLGKKSDCILDNVVPMLLKKAADTNAFIAEEAEKALIKAWENWSESKLVSAALSLSRVKTNGVKEKIFVAINTIIEKMQERFKSFKDRDRVVSFLASGMNEAAQEVRNAAKSGFMILKNCLTNHDFERLVMRSTSDKDYAKVLDFLEKESTSTDKFMITNGISTKGTFYYNKTRMSKISKQASGGLGDYGDLESTVMSSKGGANKFAKTKASIYKKNSISSSGYGNTTSNFELISTEVQEKFNDIIKTFQDSDWKKRVSGLKSLSNFIQEEEKLINKSKKFFKIIDVIVQCLKDNNNKVVTAAQDIFTNILPNIKMLVEKGATQLIEGLASNVVSSNAMIKNWGQALMKKLLLNEELECSVFIQPMCHHILQGNARAKATILNVIWEVIDIVYEVKPISVTKHIYSLCSKLLDDVSVKGETKKSLYDLIGKWYELGGESFVNSFPSRNTDRVWTILKNETNSIFG